MIKIGICDDDIFFLNRAEKDLKNYITGKQLEAELYLFRDEKQLNDYIQKGNILNLLFLDIVFEQENGISIARRINHLLPRCQIVFVTNYNEYSMDVYDADHVGYILKNEFSQRLEQTFRHILNQKKFLTLPSNGTQVSVFLTDICYIERGRRICKIVNWNQKQDEERVVQISFDKLESMLTSDCFIRCHHSFIVNLHEVRVYTTGSFTMSNGVTIPISRRYRNAVQDCFLDWQKGWL